MMKILDDAQTEFITGPVSILVGSCNASLEPSLVRAFGCRVAGGAREITVLLAVAHSAALISDLSAGHGVAVVFSRPATHQTLQLKAPHARLLPLEVGDRALIKRYVQCFSAEIAALGFNREFTDAFCSAAGGDAVAMVFDPVAAFEQTPGPEAGQMLVSH